MNRQQGFSLLEILVAFSILAVSLGILMKIFSSGVNTAMIAEEYTIATQIAESVMAKAGTEIALEVGESSGNVFEKYNWKLVIMNLPGFEVYGETDEQLYNVQVVVEWGDNQLTNRAIELNTVKIGQKQ